MDNACEKNQCLETSFSRGHYYWSTGSTNWPKHMIVVCSCLLAKFASSWRHSRQNEWRHGNVLGFLTVSKHSGHSASFLRILKRWRTSLIKASRAEMWVSLEGDVTGITKETISAFRFAKLSQGGKEVFFFPVSIFKILAFVFLSVFDVQCLWKESIFRGFFFLERTLLLIYRIHK